MMTVLLCIKPLRVPKFVCFKIILLVGERYKYNVLIKKNTPREKLIKRAVRAGNIAVLGQILKNEQPLFNEMLARTGNELIFSQDFNRSRVFITACEKGQVNLVRKLFDQITIKTKREVLLFHNVKNLEILEMLAYDDMDNFGSQDCIKKFIHAGALKLLKQCKVTEKYVNNLLRCGSEEVIREYLYLFEKDKHYSTEKKYVYNTLSVAGYKVSLINFIEQNYREKILCCSDFVDMASFEFFKQNAPPNSIIHGSFLMNCGKRRSVDMKKKANYCMENVNNYPKFVLSLFIRTFKYNMEKTEKLRVLLDMKHEDLFKIAADNNLFTMAQHYFSASFNISYELCYLDNISIVQEILIRNKKKISSISTAACRRNHVPLLEFCCHDGTNYPQLIETAISSSSVECLEFLVKRYKVKISNFLHLAKKFRVDDIFKNCQDFK